MEYSPERRTALVLCGTGAHGAYHAGVLRAMQEAGVKIDVMAGHGVGAAAAALAAIDGAATLWDPKGVWRGPHVRTLYRWRRVLRVAAWLTVALLAVVLSPLLLLVAGLVVYPLGFLLEMLGTSAGGWLVGRYSAGLQTAIAGVNLPTIVPRIAMVLGASVALVLFAGGVIAHLRAPARRQSRGGWWWRLPGAPVDPSAAHHEFATAIWHLIRGAAEPKLPDPQTMGRRYAELLGESLGQPGIRELVIVATDLDARNDLTAALLREPFRQAFFAARPGRERQSEALDLAGAGRDHALDVVAGALTPAFAVEPYLVRFAADGYWRGEVHRVCDRSGSAIRLLEELHAAGVEQAIVVSASDPRPAPHRLALTGVGILSRLGDAIAAAEAVSLRDGLAAYRGRFAAVYAVTPAHNPIGPFDFDGAYDETSDRRQTLTELMDRGYEDAHRQFIEPILGASGEHLRMGATHGEGLLDHVDS